MNYEKKYKEALEKARKLYEQGTITESLSHVFPELKESECEKIRKAILELVRQSSEILEKKNQEQMIAWLEKQGEQKSINDLTQQEAMDIAVAKCFEQGEQKSEEVDNLHNYLYGEQNPAWSEEDEIALGDAMWCCKQAASIAKDENDMGNVWYAEHWLKSLRPQNRWKPSEDKIECLSDAIKHYNSLGYPATKLKELLDDLKKLREK